MKQIGKVKDEASCTKDINEMHTYTADMGPKILEEPLNC